jgi:molecular chaperone GrpE
MIRSQSDGAGAGDGDPLRRAQDAARRAAEEESAHPASGGAAYDPSLEEDLPAQVELDEEGAAAACDFTLDEQLFAAREEAAAHRDRAMRAQAEFENYRKRMQREQADLVSRAAERVVSEMLPALDNLERALVHVKEGGDAAQLLKGVEMTHGQIVDVLAKEGVEVIDPVGEPFDPVQHQAVGQKEDPSVPDHTVAAVYLRGYRMGGRVVRPASVVVAVGGPAAPEGGHEDGGPAPAGR